MLGAPDRNKAFDPLGEEKMRGPHTLLLADCRGVTLRGVTLRDSGNYAFLFYGRNIARLSLDRIRLVTQDGNDARPVVRIDQVDKLRLAHVQHSLLPPDAAPIEYNGAKAVQRDDAQQQPLPPRMKANR